MCYIASTSVVSKDASSGGLCSRRPKRKDLSQIVGSHPSSLSCRTLLHRFLERLSGSDSRRAAYSRRNTGETTHVERWNNTLRQRLARFVRKTLSFSKSLFMHEACLRPFLHRYNRERASILM